MKSRYDALNFLSAVRKQKDAIEALENATEELKNKHDGLQSLIIERQTYIDVGHNPSESLELFISNLTNEIALAQQGLEGLIANAQAAQEQVQRLKAVAERGVDAVDDEAAEAQAGLKL